MTDIDRLEEIKERFGAIIPGPWRWFGNTATDQCYLGTTNRGRLIVLSPEVRTVEHVYNHSWCESYTLPQARENIVNFCGVHDVDPVEGECKCGEIGDFLRGELDPRDPYHQAKDLDRDGHTWLSRGVTHVADLRFADPPQPGWAPEAVERRKTHGGRVLESYRKFVRYEVLGQLVDGYFRRFRTRAENPTGELYREEFIERAPEDIGFLLGELDRLGGLLDTMEGVREPGWWR